MTSTGKIIIGAVIAVLVLAGAYYWYTTQMQPASSTSQTTAAGETTTLPSGANTSDAALSQDLNSIDTQMQGVSSDNANVSASVSAAAQ